MVNGIRTSNPHGFSKGRSSKFCEGSRVRQTSEESRRTYQPKRCVNSNKDEDKSPKNLNDKNHQALSQKFRQLISINSLFAYIFNYLLLFASWLLLDCFQVKFSWFRTEEVFDKYSYLILLWRNIFHSDHFVKNEKDGNFSVEVLLHIVKAEEQPKHFIRKTNFKNQYGNISEVTDKHIPQTIKG